MQAIVRGKRIRTLLKTSEVQGLISTLREVEKLSHQFQQDILTDNVKKADISFHRALFGQVFPIIRDQ